MHPRRWRREANPALAQLAVRPLDVVAVEEDVRVRKDVGDVASGLVGGTPAQDEHDGAIGRLDLDPAFVAERLVASQRKADDVGPEALRRLLIVDGDDHLPHTADHIVDAGRPVLRGAKDSSSVETSPGAAADH